MMKKEDLKTFKGKVLRTKTKNPKIKQIFYWNSKLKKYKTSDNPFYTYRYEPTPQGTLRRTFRNFKTIGEAKKWQQFGRVVESDIKTPKSLKKTYAPILEKEGDSYVAVSKKTKEYTFLDLYEDFKEKRLPLITLGTRRHYLMMSKYFVFLYDTEMKDMTPDRIDQWVLWLKKASKKYISSRCDFSKELDMARAIFNWHVNHNRISNWSNPIRKTHYEMSVIRPKREKVRNFMTEKEKEKWYETLKEHRPQFFAPAFVQTEQVMRVGETFAMLWENVNWEDRTYLVTGHIFWDRVKDQKPTIVQGTKTQKKAFVMPLRKPVLKLLKELYEKRDKRCRYIFHDENKKLWKYKKIQNAYNCCFKRRNFLIRGLTF